jgi:hypothetical protein
MQRVQLLSRPGGIAVAAAYLNPVIGRNEYRLYPAAGTRQRWLGEQRTVRFLDGTEITVNVTEVHSTLRIDWLTARELTTIE